MKRFLAAAVFLTMLGAALPAHALTPGESAGKDVKAVYESDGGASIYTAVITDGEASVDMGGGFHIALSGAGGSLDGALFSVRSITETETQAYAWFQEVMKSFGSVIMPFELFFIKDGRRVIPDGSIKIAVSCPVSAAYTDIYYVSQSGAATRMSSVPQKGSFLFEMKQDGYFVLANRPRSAEEAPATGERLPPVLAFAFFSVSSLFFTLSFIIRKRSQMGVPHSVKERFN